MALSVEIVEQEALGLDDVRRCLTRRFPYGIYHTMEGSDAKDGSALN